MANKIPYLIVIGGPTASGKTTLAIAMAKALQTEIINADSRQFYSEMKIGTARPSQEELQLVPHHFVGDRSLSETLSAGAFAREALAKLKELFLQQDHVILSGGSGLFVKAVTEGLDHFPPVPQEIRQEVEALFQTGGLLALQSQLAHKDPFYYASVDQQNPARLRRALEVIKASGQPFSSFQEQQRKARPFRCVYLSAFRPRQLLYQRINQRADRMIEAGLVEEVKALLPYQNTSVLRTLGYQELFAHLRGEYDLARAVELIKQGSRRYAKRQITWLRRDGFWKNIDPDQPEEGLAYLDFCKKYNLNLHTQREADAHVLAFQQNGRWVARQIYVMGKKKELGESTQREEAPDAAVGWLRQEAERRLIQ